MNVMGAGGVTVIDASGLRYTDSYAVQRGQPLAMLGLKLDFLTSGCRYDLRSRVGIAPQHATRIDPLMEPVPVEEAPADPTPVGMRDGE
jgi:cyanophycinase-like exopeptidase